jgi:hypothetical protein
VSIPWTGCVRWLMVRPGSFAKPGPRTGPDLTNLPQVTGPVMELSERHAKIRDAITTNEALEQ